MCRPYPLQPDWDVRAIPKCVQQPRRRLMDRKAIAAPAVQPPCAGCIRRHWIAPGRQAAKIRPPPNAFQAGPDRLSPPASEVRSAQWWNNAHIRGFPAKYRQKAKSADQGARPGSAQPGAFHGRDWHRRAAAKSRRSRRQDVGCDPAVPVIAFHPAVFQRYHQHANVHAHQAGGRAGSALGKVLAPGRKYPVAHGG